MYRLMFAMLVGTFLVGCETGTTVDPPADREWQAVLAGEGDWAHLGGSSTVVSTEGTTQFTATAELTGDEEGAVRPWHVHFNSCAEGGGIVGANNDYPRLEVGADGTATVTVTINEPLQTGAAYHVNVHRSNEDLATIIACGDLVLTGP